jgi:hypothetical protein
MAEKEKMAKEPMPPMNVWLPPVALSWLVPGGGHFLLKRTGRGLLLAASITCMFVLGLLMRGAMFKPQSGDILTILINWGGFAGDIASGILYLLIILLRRRLSLRQTVVAVIVGFVLIVVLWLIRGNWWNLIFAQLVITFVLLSIRMFRERIFPVGNIVVLIVIFVAALMIPNRIKVMTVGGSVQPTAVFAIPSSSRPASSNSMWSRFVTQIRARRRAFRIYALRQSDIDSDVDFNDAGDIVRFLPRAAVVGFFAPFPRMWLETGTGGRMGRILSGLETFGMYLLYFPAALIGGAAVMRTLAWLLQGASFAALFITVELATAIILYRAASAPYA